jgi:hypothetical protein
MEARENLLEAHLQAPQAGVPILQRFRDTVTI